MALHVKLLVISVFLLSTLGSCRAKNATLEVAGLMHCTDCINNQSSTTNSSLGLEVLIRCNANEMRARGTGGVDEHGKFNVTLSGEMAEDSGAAYGCYAKLQSRSGAPCRIQAPQTASVKILSNSATTTLVNRPTVIKFSPITCQSAFFWPFPNHTFFGSSPPAPPEYTAPPPPANLPPAASPVQPPTPPPQASYDPPAPSLPPPEIEAPTPPRQLPPPPSSAVYSRPSSPPLPAPLNAPIRSPIPPKQAPPPTVMAPTPAPLNAPIQSPFPPKQAPPATVMAPTPAPLNAPIQSPFPPKQAPPATVMAPTPAPLNAPIQSPFPPKQAPPATVMAPTPAPSAGISIAPRRRRPSPIPKAPRIPRLPLTPSVPRKYFNPPKSISKPPRSL